LDVEDAAIKECYRYICSLFMPGGGWRPCVHQCALVRFSSEDITLDQIELEHHHLIRLEPYSWSHLV
jgi:hypothetical protein